MSELTVLLTSGPDQDDLVAEIWRGDQYVADVLAEGDRFLVTWSSESGIPVQVGTDDLIEALKQACQSLAR